MLKEKSRSATEVGNLILVELLACMVNGMIGMVPCSICSQTVSTCILQDLFGDGFVLWYAKERMENGPAFGSKDYFSGTTVLVDH